MSYTYRFEFIPFEGTWGGQLPHNNFYGPDENPFEDAKQFLLNDPDLERVNVYVEEVLENGESVWELAHSIRRF